MPPEQYMKRALALALQGRGSTSPNPMVGAILVKYGEVVGEGFHRKAGLPHAEIEAIRQAGEKARGATLYVTLEPCTHHGKTPPCTEALRQTGIKKVVVATLDSNPKINGAGIAMLRQVGIDVEVGILEKEAQKINEAFLKWISTGMPFIILKFAMTLDGKIAAKIPAEPPRSPRGAGSGVRGPGISQWITGEKARESARAMRGWYDAVLVGVNTVLKDDPQLTCRMPGQKNPIRVILDSTLKTPLDAKVIQTCAETPTWIATVSKDKTKRKRLEDAGARVLIMPEEDGKVSVKELCRYFGSHEITGVFVEGGAQVHGSFLKAGLADKILAFIAPKILGDQGALGPIEGWGQRTIGEALKLNNISITQLEEDLLLEGYF